jgi:hypothetical protein
VGDGAGRDIARRCCDDDLVAGAESGEVDTLALAFVSRRAGQDDLRNEHDGSEAIVELGVFVAE